MFPRIIQVTDFACKQMSPSGEQLHPCFIEILGEIWDIYMTKVQHEALVSQDKVLKH